MKNKIFALILGMFLIISLGGVSALDSLGTFKSGENVRITQICDDATYITLSSVSYPNSTNATSALNMTSVGSGEFYYDFNLTDTLGRYDVRGISNGCTKTFATYFMITGIGLNQTTSQGISSAIFLILMVVLMFAFGIVGFKLFKTQTLWVLGIFFVFLAVLLLVYNTWLGYEYHRTLTGLPDSSIPETIFYIFLLVLVLGLLVSLALLILNWKKVFKYIKREIKSNKDKEDKDVEDWDFDEWKGAGPYGK